MGCGCEEKAKQRKLEEVALKRAEARRHQAAARTRDGSLYDLVEENVKLKKQLQALAQVNKSLIERYESLMDDPEYPGLPPVNDVY